MFSSRTRLPEIVRQTPVETDGKKLTVSTIRIKRGYYDTVIFDDSTDKRHTGQMLAGFVIDQSSKRAETREAAMDDHREALYAARTEEPFPPRGGHDATCAYVSGMTTRCTCASKEAAR
ncbi:hypothetical protein ACIQXA_08685 [Streptomyces massasporeus]|uniref:hypothetical protein n=1 Tax=Streptomyces massasporeus TaxID=67324 RepID=UPI0037F5F90C